MPLPFPTQILYEDNHLIAVNKSAGQIVQGDKTGDICLADMVKQYLREKYHKEGNAFCGVIHRLDRPVSGVILFAKTGKALSRMNNLVRERSIRKSYWAIVSNRPPCLQDTLVNYLVKNEQQNKSYVVPAHTPHALKAELKYNLLSESQHYSLLEIDLLTGRHHQIRVQLSHIGCPIKGDLKYQAHRSNTDGSIGLHARRIQFVHPVKQSLVDLIAPVPHDTLWQFFEKEIEK